MNFRSLLLLLTALTPAAALAQSPDNKKNADGGASNSLPSVAVKVPAVLDERTRLMQEYMAARAELWEKQKASKERAKNAKTSSDKKKESDLREKDEKEFATKNADLIRRFKASEEAFRKSSASSAKK